MLTTLLLCSPPFVCGHGASRTCQSLVTLITVFVTIVFRHGMSRGRARYSESQGRKTKSDKYHFYRFLICASCHCSEKVAAKIEAQSENKSPLLLISENASQFLPSSSLNSLQGPFLLWKPDF